VYAHRNQSEVSQGGIAVFQSAAIELARLEHYHGNGEYHDMHEVSEAHDSAEGDPERSWSKGRIYRCNVCEDEVRVSLADPSPVEGSLTPPAP
jgi:hypothetical protein